MNIKTGDWVRFYRGGVITLSVVQYVRELKSYPYGLGVYTDVALISMSDVLEVRSAREVESA